MTDLTAAAPLREASLVARDDAVSLPDYDRSQLRPAIVHLGVGGFHRAHLATYADELAASGNTQWGIAGCGVLASDKPMADALQTQDGLYSLIVRSPESTTVRVIGSIVRYIRAFENPQSLIEAIADPSTQIVSLTITEGGYPIDDFDGKFVPTSANAEPQSAFGLLVAGLDERRKSCSTPLTVLSCDNIIGNGGATRTATLGIAQRTSPELATWISQNVSFPNSMVDRITPATTDTDREWLAHTHGIDDRWPVVTEPFRQWVIEDNFAGERPPLEQLDVIITADVEPYEQMKLRLLNAAHSCLAYLSALLGHQTVDQAMADPTISVYTRAFLDHEAKRALPEIHGIDVDNYISTLIERFANPAVGDQIQRLCLDGSAKLPKFVLPTVHDNASHGRSLQLAALALAGWCEYLRASDDPNSELTAASDPRLAAATEHARASVADPLAFLQFTPVFDEELRTNDAFTFAFSEALQSIRLRGVRSAIDVVVGKLNGEASGDE